MNIKDLKSDIHRTHYSIDLNENLIGKNVKIAGWLEDIRDIGKIIFLIIKDVYGPVQVIVDPNKFPNVKEIPRQSAIIIEGEVKQSKAKNMKIEVELKKIIDTLNAIHPLPIDPTGRIESSIDKRLNSRALDLRNSNVSKLFILRSLVLEIIRKNLREKRFIEVNTPKIIGSASEGGADLFDFNYFKTKAYLAQSPQLYKEEVILALDRVFEIAPYFRAENSNTIRHLTEFHSVDIEAAFLDYQDIMDIMEEVIKNVINEIKISNLIDVSKVGIINNTDLSKKFERLTYSRCIKELNNLDEKIEFGEDLSDSALRKLGTKYPGFYFITDWPLKLKPFYIHEKENEPELSESFDLQIGFLELISGGRRQHNPKKIKNRLIVQGLDPNDFKEHLEVYNWGMPPHSGCGLGLDRLIMALTGAQNVREVVLYPRDPDRIKP